MSPPVESSNSARTNIEELGLLINIPAYEAEDIVWKEDPSQKRLVAVFRFSHDDSTKLIEATASSDTPRVVNVAVEAWFPDELIAQGDMSGDSGLRGTAYPATAFYQPPYTSGSLVRIESTDYFVLELTSK